MATHIARIRTVGVADEYILLACLSDRRRPRDVGAVGRPRRFDDDVAVQGVEHGRDQVIPTPTSGFDWSYREQDRRGRCAVGRIVVE